MTGIKGRIATLVAVCVFLVGVGGSYAQAQSTTAQGGGTSSHGGATTTTSGSATTHKSEAHKGHKHKADRGVGGQIVSVSNGQLTVKKADGTTQAFTLDANTKVRVDGKQGSASDLKPGMRVRVHTKQVSGQQVVTKVSAHTPKAASSSGTASPSGS